MPKPKVVTPDLICVAYVDRRTTNDRVAITRRLSGKMDSPFAREMLEGQALRELAAAAIPSTTAALDARFENARWELAQPGRANDFALSVVDLALEWGKVTGARAALVDIVPTAWRQATELDL